MSTSASSIFALRPAQEDDLPFLYRVYASTRQEELALVDWDEAQKEWFLRMQFDLQRAPMLRLFPRRTARSFCTTANPSAADGQPHARPDSSG